MQIREQLHKQIDLLPDEVVEQIADFTAFLITKKGIEIERSQWRDFALAQFFRDDDEVAYSLGDAQDVF
ncbi:MAG: hypothetical protein IAF02_17530 [Anaerolineae bacterium]|nr:hypothetical protein [Anaerolineae bacterium]